MLRATTHPSTTSTSTVQTLPVKTRTTLLSTHLPSLVMTNVLREVKDAFEGHLTTHSLLSLSKSLQAELRQHMVSSPQSMLPSFNYTLPTGKEQGTYLAVEVGGSNLRMALVELRGRSRGQGCLQIRRTTTACISQAVKQYQGHAFFDWMVENIKNLLVLEGETRENAEPLRMGVAWSFPIDQTSIRSGIVLGMGKGFLCSDMVKNCDLGDIIAQACRRHNVNVQLTAIVNDTSSTLLARAYLDPATRLAVVLGTGMNAAIHLPIAALHPSKFSLRFVKPSSQATHVLTNTEFSMFGKYIFPQARWDDTLNKSHMMPDYQPFEYLIAGGYMGEILRLIMADAAHTAGLYGGSLPESLLSPYSLDTRTLALIEVDTSAGLTTTRDILHDRHPSTFRPSFADADFIQKVVFSISRRSIAYFATGVHALTSLLQDLEAEAGLKNDCDHISIGCDGSVINKYPGFMAKTQETLHQMRLLEGNYRKKVFLEKTQDSAVVGAGVAGALAVQ